MKVFYFYLKTYNSKKGDTSSYDIIVTCIFYLIESLCDLWFVLQDVTLSRTFIMSIIDNVIDAVHDNMKITLCMFCQMV